MERATFIRESINFLQSYMMKSLQKHAEEQGVTIPQARVIGEVFAHKAVTIKQLSQNLRMTQSTASDIVERLSAKGLLVKTPNPRDKRSVEISLPAELAEKMSGSIAEIGNQSLTGVLDFLNQSEQEIVEKGMQLLVQAVKQKVEEEGMEYYEFFDVLYFLGGSKQKKVKDNGEDTR